MKFRTQLSAVACLSLAFTATSLSQADQEWNHYLNLSPNQKSQYKPAEQNRKTAIEQAKKDREATADNLAAQVQTNAGDTVIQPIFTQLLSETKTIDDAEEVFWRTISGFLTPTQVGKIFLKWHQPKNPSSQPPAPPKPAIQNPAPSFNWNTYFGFNKDQQGQLKAADQARGGQMKTDKQNFENTLAQLGQQVQGNAGDGQVQMTLTSLFSIQEDQHHTEQTFWGTSLPGFLTPTQVAKLYLHRHPPKGGFNPPAQIIPVTSPAH